MADEKPEEKARKIVSRMVKQAIALDGSCKLSQFEFSGAM
jgi:hypothetical protein